MAAYSGVTTRHLAPLVHLLGIAGIVLMVVWTYSFRGGYGLSGAGVFNLHPLIMFAGFIFLSSEAIVVYKIGRGDRAWQKAVHMSVQGVAIVLAVVGVCAAYKFHIDNGIQNFYSLHSWFGVTTIAVYVVQWGWGFVAFWQQRGTKAKRGELLPWHVFVGLAAYAAALVTAELGLLEKLTFLQKSGGSPLGLWSREAMLVNFVGIAIFVYGAVVVLTTLVPKSRKEAGYRDMLEIELPAAVEAFVNGLSDYALEEQAAEAEASSRLESELREHDGTAISQFITIDKNQVEWVTTC